MRNLNYFFPYDKGTFNHEDHLTRAFLILLKYSPSALKSFYTYVKEKTDNPELKPLYKCDFKNVNFETQVGSLPNSSTYASILITNESIELKKEITPLDRKAIYDGVIDFDNELVFFIETKPNKKNVWENQLCPSIKDIPEDSTLIREPIILEWKEVINFLHKINEDEITLPNEKLFISDFFDLINTHFDYLNPYNDFSKCHSNYLVSKRIDQILKEISSVEDKVKFHSGWGYYIELDFPEIKKIALLQHNDEEGNWSGLTIGTDFGSTVSQAREFYSKIESIDNIKNWSIYPNFHLAFKNQNLVFFNSPELTTYFEYYNDKNKIWEKIRQIPKTQLQDWLNNLVKLNVLEFPNEKKEEVKEKIMNKGYTTVNLCPALYMEYYISKEEAIELDSSGELIPIIKNEMKKILNVIKQNTNKIIAST